MSSFMFSKESLEKGARALERFIDGEPKNINPLTEIQKPEMTLYGIYGSYFDTPEELKNHCIIKGIPLDDAHVLEYIRIFAGRNDVIKKTNKDGKTMFYTAVDEDGYGIYNNERSIYRGEFIWEYNYGQIREFYNPFRERGIVFENDIYVKVDERMKLILKHCRNNNLFNMGKNG